MDTFATRGAPAPAPSSSDGDPSTSLSKANEAAWLQVAAFAEEQNDVQKAADAYEHVLLSNANNVHALLQLASISRMQESFGKAVEYLTKILEIDGSSGEVHGAIGHCYLTLSQRAEGVPAIMECLKKCYNSYNEASQHMGAFSDPNLWYGIGLLYERYGALMLSGMPQQQECYEAAEEALRSVLQAAPQFEKRSEILYRLGMIYKQQSRPQQALECFQSICDEPPSPLTQADVWFLIGSVQETMDPPAPEFARQAYEHVLRLMQIAQDPKVSRVYRQLGWVCHHFNLQPPPIVAPYGVAHQVQQSPLLCLQQALEMNPADAANWTHVAKCLLDHSEHERAYDCLVHAVQIDPSDAEVWQTVGEVFSAMGGRTADAVTAFEHAVHLHPRSPAWYQLGVARHEMLVQQGAAGSPATPEALTAAVEAYTKALTICTSKREEISARLEQLQTYSMPAAAAGDAPIAAPKSALPGNGGVSEHSLLAAATPAVSASIKEAELTAEAAAASEAVSSLASRPTPFAPPVAAQAGPVKAEMGTTAEEAAVPT